MKAVLMEEMMARQKSNKQPVKLDRDVYRMASLIATIRDVAISEYVSDLLRPLVERDYPQAVIQLSKGGDVIAKTEDTPPSPPPKRRRRQK